jgi:hypothetical protein
MPTKEKIKIGFRMPFEPSGGDGVVSTKNYKINTRRIDSNGGSVYKTPQIRTTGRKVD